MKNVLAFIDKWGFRVLFPLFLIMFLKTCSTNNNIEKAEKNVSENIIRIDSLLNLMGKNILNREEMVFLIKNTPNWKTLELEELSDKNRIPINKLKNDEE
tara:strand:+ start:5196 stop:5495 length:300 start_codon:yes stop_codon:yes gene_type:complete